MTPSSGSTAPTAAPSDPYLCLLLGPGACGAAVPPAYPTPSAGGPRSWLNLTPSPFPSDYLAQRAAAALTYDVDTHSVLLFGGFSHDYSPPYTNTEFQDTWSFSAGNWTELIDPTQCSSATCPSARLAAAFAYDAADHEAVLFGGASATGNPLPLLKDTWVYSGGQWTNVTASSGLGPSARYGAAMSYDSADGYVLLFGGANATGTSFADTWEYAAGRWTNVTGTTGASPDARTYASLADSPTGYLMLFGGEDNGTVVEANCYGGSPPWLQWWFHAGKWLAAYKPLVCPPAGPGSPSAYTSGQGPPCGRMEAALQWSPKNHRFVLFGGFGRPPVNGICSLNTSVQLLNDTWLYEGPPNGTSTQWVNDTLPGAPSPRAYMGSASDFTDGYALIFGGIGFFADTNQSWRYFAPVTARLSGPLTMMATSVGFNEFTLEGFGGSGDLDYSFQLAREKTPHGLNGTGDCAELSDGSVHNLSTYGTQIIQCTPDATSYNIFRLSVTVWDAENPTQRAYANWTVTVTPPEKIAIYTQYTGYFYAGFQMDNIFGVNAEIGNGAVSSLTGTLDGLPVTFGPAKNGSPLWWNSSQFNMGSISPGSQLEVTASIADWSENASLGVTIVQTPDWLQQLAGLAQAIQTETTTGTGPWNLQYTLSQQVSIPIGQLFNFSIPVPLASGNYSLVPSLQLAFSETSLGNVTLSGTFALSTPSISLGAFSLTISASVKVSGTFAVGPAGGNPTPTITWLKATVTISIKGDFKGSFPLYGFSFDLFGQTIKIGFTLDIDVAPAIALDLIMAPATSPTNQVVQNYSLMVQSVVGDFLLPISVDVSFGIGIASVAVGGTISVDVDFQASPGPFGISGLYVNGSIFVNAQILFWSGSWDLVGPGVIYHWVPTPLGPRLLAGSSTGGTYDNGSDAVWQPAPRYYNVSGYDQPVWAAAGSSGAAVANIYPWTQVNAAPAYNGADLFYTDDRVDRPVAQGLTVSGLRLDLANNTLVTLPSPPNPGFDMANPRATTLPDGSLYVVWQALPYNESAANTPADVTLVLAQGAQFFPANDSWGPVQTYTTTGVAESLAVDSTGGTDVLTVLTCATLLPSDTTPELLRTFDLATAQSRSIASVTGLGAVDSVRGAAGLAAVRALNGTVEVVGLGSGAVASLPTPPAPNGELVAASFVPGTNATLLLRYRLATSSPYTLYDAANPRVVAQGTLGGNVSDIEAWASAGQSFVFASVGGTVQAWVIVGATATNLSGITAPFSHFRLVQFGSSVVLYSLQSTGPASSPTRTLAFLEVPLSLTPLPGPASPPPPPQGPAQNPPQPPYALYAGVAAAAGAAVLLVGLLTYRRRPRTPPAAPSVSHPPPVEPTT